MSVSKFGTTENHIQTGYDSQIIGGLNSKASKIQNGIIDHIVTVKNEDGDMDDSGISKSSLVTLPIDNDLNMSGKKL